MLARQHTAITTHKCPKCGTDKVRRATRSGTLDRVLSYINVYPYRCRKCSSRNRFYNFGRR